ncbi:MAG: elongation factor 1-beta [Candidatus Pacearchaeota archaeon]
MKVLPENPSVDLKLIKSEIEKNIKKNNGKLEKFEEEPIAFGLKALIVTISWPESQDTNLVEEMIKKIKNVSSVDIIDYRRAFG